MKKNFLTGLVILLPIAITFWVIIFLVNLLTNPFLNTVKSLLSHYHIISHPTFLIFISRLSILLFLFGIAVLAGFLARILFINYMFRLGDYLIHRIPFINKIYKAAQDVTHTLFGKEKTSFSQVVLVPFPHSKCYSIGFITEGKENQIRNNPDFKEKVSILVPGTPNPLMGFMLIYKQEEIVYLDIKPEEAAKFVISCGVMLPEFKPKEI